MSSAPLSTWRELQLEILEAARHLRRDSKQQEHSARDGAQSDTSHAALWSMLSDSFWMERDPARLSGMIEDVISELEARIR